MPANFKFRYDGLRLLVFALCALCFLATAAGVTFWSGFGILPAYLLLLLGGLTCVMGAALLADHERPPQAYSRLDWLIAAVLFVAAAALRFRHLGTVPLWGDEDLQDWFVLRGVNIIYMAAYGQQPPLHHFLALATLKLFGVTLFNLRFFTALLGALAVPAFYFLVRKCGCRPLIAAAGGILFSSNIWLVSYSQESKPYMMAVFFCVISLLAFVDFFRARGSHLAWITLTAVNILFLHTVGVQPLVFLLIAEGLLLVWLGLRGERKLFGLVAASAAVSFVAFLPDLYAIRLLSMRKGYIRPFPAPGELLARITGGFPAFCNELRVILETNIWFLWIGLAVWLGTRLFRAPRTAASAWLAPALLLTVLFPLGIYIFFAFFVVNQIFYYYVILIWPPLLWLAALSAESLTAQAAKLGRRSGALTGIALFLLAGAVAANELGKPSTKQSERNIPGVFEYFREHAPENSWAFYFTINETPPNPAVNSQIGFMGTDYYYTPDVARKVKLDSAWDRQLKYGTQLDAIFELIESSAEPARLYFFSFDREVEFDIRRIRFSPALHAEVIHFADPRYGAWAETTLVGIANPFGMRKSLATFLGDLEKQLPRDSLKLKIFLLQADIATYEKDCGGAKSYFAKARALCAGHAPDCRVEPRLRKSYERLCLQGKPLREPLW